MVEAVWKNRLPSLASSSSLSSSFLLEGGRQKARGLGSGGHRRHQEPAAWDGVECGKALGLPGVAGLAHRCRSCLVSNFLHCLPQLEACPDSRLSSCHLYGRRPILHFMTSMTALVCLEGKHVRDHRTSLSFWPSCSRLQVTLS